MLATSSTRRIAHWLAAARTMTLATGSVVALSACNDDLRLPTPASRVAGPAATTPSLAKSAGRGPSRIAFIGANKHLMSILSDGSGFTELVSAPAIEDDEPSWSADYSKLLFISNRGGALRQVYSVNADFTNVVPMITGLYVFNARFSPDGSRIVFSTATLSGNTDVWVQDIASGTRTQLTTDPSTDTDPQYSPDGSKILFSSLRSGTTELYVMNADGTNQTRLTHCRLDCGSAAWSPDGSRIAFAGSVFGAATVFTMSTSGDGRYVPVNGSPVNALEFHRAPTFSPDGKKIAFQSNRNGRTDLWTAALDGSGMTPLTLALPAGARAPAWSY